MERRIFGKAFVTDMDEIYSMSKLLPKRSKIATPLYVDDTGSYRTSKHWKRVKFKQNDDVKYADDWAPMNFDGKIMKDENSLDIRLSSKEIEEIKNFVRNNKCVLEALCERDEIDFDDFLSAMIPGGEPATQEQIDEQKRKVDELLKGEE